MKENLHISLVQSNVFWENKQKNLSHLSKLLNTINKTDIILLPEMFNTAFSPSAIHLAENMDGKTVRWMKNIAIKKKCVVAGSLMIKEGLNAYNRLVWVSEEEVYTYDKTHLFSLAKENKTITAGGSRLIIQFNEWKICPLICYDLRFPVFSRNNVDYDILIYLANWPVKRIKDWKILLQARAIENQCFVFGVNRVGEDLSKVYFNGQSVGYNAFGEKICSAKELEDVMQIQIQKRDLIKKRRQYNFLKDRDRFKLI